MSRPASPYLSKSFSSPRVSSARSRRNSRNSGAPMKAFRSASPSMSAMMSVRNSQAVTAPRALENNRPSVLPEAEELYDELKITRKEISTQKKILTFQKTRNERLAGELKKCENQLNDVLTEKSSTGSTKEQLHAKIFNLERQLRQKDLEFGKLKFDTKTTDMNELKLTVEIYAAEVDRLKNLSADKMYESRESVQKEQKQQISQLRIALAAVGKEKDVLQLEKEKYLSQLDGLKGSKLNGQLKQKKEIDHLKFQLRKARVSNPNSVEESLKPKIQTDDKYDTIITENNHLRNKIDRMAEEMNQLQSQLEFEKNHQPEKKEHETTVLELQNQIKDNEKLIDELRNRASTLERENIKLINAPVTQVLTKKEVQTSSSLQSLTPANLIRNNSEEDIVGAIAAHIYRTDAISV